MKASSRWTERQERCSSCLRMRSNQVEVSWRQTQYSSMVRGRRQVSYPQAHNDQAPVPGNSQKGLDTSCAGKRVAAAQARGENSRGRIPAGTWIHSRAVWTEGLRGGGASPLLKWLYCRSAAARLCYACETELRHRFLALFVHFAPCKNAVQEKPCFLCDCVVLEKWKTDQQHMRWDAPGCATSESRSV